MARSSERDIINDRARISGVERSVYLALESPDREKRGLIRRVKRTVVGPSSISIDTVAADTPVSAFEQVEGRIRSLEQQIEMFRRIKALLDEGRAPAQDAHR